MYKAKNEPSRKVQTLGGDDVPCRFILGETWTILTSRIGNGDGDVGGRGVFFVVNLKLL